MTQVSKELKRLNESLLSNSIDYTKSESSFDERTLDVLKKTMFDFFRSVDKQDLGVVSYKECAEVNLDKISYERKGLESYGCRT